MIELKYYELYQKSKDIFSIRVELVDYANRYGIKSASIKFATTVKTVRKWVKRFKQNGKSGLYDESRRPKKNPNEMLAFWKFKILDECKRLKDNNKRIRAKRIKKVLNVPYSLPTILKVIKSNGYLKTKNTKKKRIKDLREMKRKYKAFEKIQVDIKELGDIVEFFPHLIDFKLPKYQFTAQCIRTGAMFISYGYEKSCTNATIFIIQLLEHLKKYGVRLEGNRIQTDNGCEFTTPWNSLKKSGFTKVLDMHNIIHRLIPPGASTYNSDVETSHRIIEEEFYGYEIIKSYDDFFKKAWEYSKYFNYQRENKYKGGSPLKIMKECNQNLDDKILDFKPLVLDEYLDFYKEYFLKNAN